MPKNHTGYQFKIQLNHIKPPIWRQFVVPSNITLASFHYIIQCVMGWQDCHLHAFHIGGLEYGMPDADDYNDGQVIDETTVALKNLLADAPKTMVYVYDFGDDWEHTLQFEGEVALDKNKPRILGGKRACPPEDCGGPFGYEEFLEVLQDPKHEDHEHFKEWAGDFKPEHFPLDKINRAFQA